MRRYETIVILDTDIGSDVRESSIDLVTDVIQKMDGFLVEIDEWGVRKLAYDIRKKPRGEYVRFDFCGMGPLVEEMERLFRINDQYLKFMTVLLEQAVDLEGLKAQLAEKQAAAEAEAVEKAAAQAEAEKPVADDVPPAEAAPAEDSEEKAPQAEPGDPEPQPAVADAQSAPEAAAETATPESDPQPDADTLKEE
ncbi:MAG: 30S ribosomal protein S6 [Desulfobacterales bacterium]